MLGAAAFGIGIATAVTLALYQYVLPGLAVNTLIALMAGLPYLAAVRSSYAQRISERELVAQYAHMERIFANAERLLTTTADAGRKRAVL